VNFGGGSIDRRAGVQSGKKKNTKNMRIIIFFVAKRVEKNIKTPHNTQLENDNSTNSASASGRPSSNTARSWAGRC
jgi:hypothetical protein